MLKEQLFTNMLVIDELLYISRQRFGIQYSQTLGLLRGVLLPHVRVIPLDESDVGSLERNLIRHDLKPSDALHLATMEREGIRNIVTEDEDFDRVERIPSSRKKSGKAV